MCRYQILTLSMLTLAIFNCNALADDGRAKDDHRWEDIYIRLLKGEISDITTKVYLSTRFHVVDKILSENPEFVETAFEKNLMPRPYDTYSDKIYCKYLAKYIEILKSGEDAPDTPINQTYKWNTARRVGAGTSGSAWTEHAAELYERLADDLEELDRIYPEDIRKRVNRGFRHVEALRAIRELVADPDALDSYKAYTFGEVPNKGMRGALEAIASEMPDEPSEIDFKWLLLYIAENGARADMDRMNTYIGGFDGELFWPAHSEYFRSPRLAVVDGEGQFRFLIVPKRRRNPIQSGHGIAVFSIIYNDEGKLMDYAISVVNPSNRQVVDYISSQFYPGSGKILTDDELDRMHLPFHTKLKEEKEVQ